ncbi:MAG TPA: ABC transporter permease [Vicinamibacterales bacterium]|jgi:putative ABC transport system permease protein
MNHLRRDIHYALRRLIKAPGFALVAVTTLALGIGANSAIFSVVNGVLLRPLPYPESDRLVGVYHVYNGHRAVMSGPNFIDVTRRATTFENAAAISTGRAILTGQGEPARLPIAEVSASLFNVMRVAPEIGRAFAAGENTPGATNIVILSHDLWRQRFGGDAGVLGTRIVLDGVSKQIIGVMPAGFSYPEGRAAWLPIEYDEGFVSRQRSSWFLDVVARLKPGVTPQQSAAEVEAIGRRLARDYPNDDSEIGMSTYPLLDATVGNVRRAVLILLGAVGFVLLIACTNVANLLLARASARGSEMAVRTALGANRPQLVRQLLTESVVLSLVGAGGGLLLAVWGVDLLVRLKPQGIPRLDGVRIDGAVVLFTVGIAVVTGILFGLVPAFSATTRLSDTIKASGRGGAGLRAGQRVRSLLVVAELALAVMLLAGAGLLMRSFMKLQAVDPGFSLAPALTFDLTLPDARYREDARRVAFFDALMPRLHALPGVMAASAVTGLPLSGSNFDISFEVRGRPPLPPAQQPSMQIRVATSGYFQALGIPLRRGRVFTERDTAATPPVVLITESAARRFFPGEDPLGHTIRIGWGRGPGRPRAGGEVVGIVGDVKEGGLDAADMPQLYLPFGQWPGGSMTVVLETSVPPLSLAEAVRREVYALDGNLPVSNVSTLGAVVAKSISQQRFYVLLLTIFASVALALAAVGIFSVLSYAVSQRTREIGIRMALGAPGRSVLTLIVHQAAILIACGVATGLALGLMLSQTLAKMLFDVTPTDPVTFATVAAVLAAVALLASYLPARRATRVDPIVALRAE